MNSTFCCCQVNIHGKSMELAQTETKSVSTQVMLSSVFTSAPIIFCHTGNHTGLRLQHNNNMQLNSNLPQFTLSNMQHSISKLRHNSSKLRQNSSVRINISKLLHNISVRNNINRLRPNSSNPGYAPDSKLSLRQNSRKMRHSSRKLRQNINKVRNNREMRKNNEKKRPARPRLFRNVLSRF